MRGTEFLDKMELINPTYVEVADVKPKKKSTWIKLGTVAACLCLMAVGALSIVNSHMKQYIVSNNIFIAPVDESSDSVSYVTPEQAECLETANTIHNRLSAQNYEWYGSCYYDFENEKIMIGLTELTDGNKEKVSVYTGNTAIGFYKCDYSYVYLEELYNKIDKRITVLSMLGVDRYNISVRENRVKVHIKNDKMYGAIYAVSKMDSSGGAIIFTSNVITADGRSG